jgi:hypothetical protein
MLTAQIPALPVVLAGPVIRRAESSVTYVWLATSERLADPELRVYEVLHESSKPTLGKLQQTGFASSFRLGAKLWIYMLGGWGERRLPPFPGQMARLPQEKLLAYDVVEASGLHRNLAALMNLKDITLDGVPFPTFVLQGPRQPLHVLYASCRKLHGEGIDAAPAFERLLTAHALDPLARIQGLFMGGDQIYADDVADLLITHLSALGRALVGRPESVPDVPHPERLPLRGRARTVAEAMLTAGAAGSNHLLTFGEWAALYLLHWNPDLWPKSYPSATRSYQAMALPRPERWIAEGYKVQLERLQNARSGSAAMRKILANVPTYMVFDDHEITDDWNLNPDWEERVKTGLSPTWKDAVFPRTPLASPRGPRIILNGMAAYWAFQGWGNEPRAFPPQNYAPVADYTRTGRRPNDAATILRSQLWAYRAPTSPPVVVVDSRTRRAPTKPVEDVVNGFTVRRNTRAPRLLNESARSLVGSMIRDGANDGTAVLLTPGPVWGIPKVERVQSIVAFLADEADADLESWTANPQSQVDIVQMAIRAGLRRLIILSGDVHYGFSAAVRLRLRGGSDVKIAQFTSSATKNYVGGNSGRGLRWLLAGPPEPRREVSVWTPTSEGPIWAVAEDPTITGLDPETDAAILQARQDATSMFGAPYWRERQRFALVHGPLSRISSDFRGLDGVIVRDNNVGELTVTGQSVIHTHWSGDPDRNAISSVTWATDDWPI